MPIHLMKIYFWFKILQQADKFICIKKYVADLGTFNNKWQMYLKKFSCLDNI